MIVNITPRRGLLLFRSMTLNGCTIPKFKLNGIILHVVASYTYIGHALHNVRSYDDDINRTPITLFVQGNVIHPCTAIV